MCVCGGGGGGGGGGGFRLYTVVEIRSMCLGHVVKWRSPRGKWVVGSTLH